MVEQEGAGPPPGWAAGQAGGAGGQAGDGQDGLGVERWLPGGVSHSQQHFGPGVQLKQLMVPAKTSYNNI